MGEAVIEARKISATIASTKILHELSFTIERGKIVSLIGANGAGKTTLIRTLAGLLPLNSGTLTLAGKASVDWSRKTLARRLSYVPQADGRDLPFTVREFVTMGRYPHLSPFSGISTDDEASVTATLSEIGMSAFATRQMDSLSGGERQKVYLAAALAQGADILLLDEPTTFLDPYHTQDILHILRRINRERGVTIIAVTHDINTAILHSERVIALRKGRLIFDDAAERLTGGGHLEEIFSRPFSRLQMNHPTRTTCEIIAPDMPSESPSS